jgi:hypothetical protein
MSTVFGYGSRLPARFAGVGRDDDLSCERRTNLRLWEMGAGDTPLFSDCYLQWMAQLQRVEP